MIPSFAQNIFEGVLLMMSKDSILDYIKSRFGLLWDLDDGWQPPFIHTHPEIVEHVRDNDI